MTHSKRGNMPNLLREKRQERILSELNKIRNGVLTFCFELYM